MNTFNKLPLLTEISLLALLAWLFMGWLLPSDQRSSSISNLASKVEPATKVLPAIAKLTAVALFGKAPLQPAAKPKPVQTIKPVVLKPLNIRLLGTVVAGDSSAAIVSFDGNSEQKTVFMGDYIQPGVKLLHVDAETIVVERSGQRQVITLQRQTLQGVVVSDDKRRLMVQTSTATLPSPSPGSAIDPSQALPKQVTTKAARHSMSRLLTQARFTPHFSDKKQDGLLISNIVVGSLYQKAGFYNGDVIRTVNGQSLYNTKNPSDFLKILQGSGTLDFEIIRAGNVQTIHFEL